MIYDKKSTFRDGLRRFIDSDKRASDYLCFIMMCRRVLSQGSGLIWIDLEVILKEELDGGE